MDWITDRIAIGGVLDARADLSGIDAVLCLLEGCPCEGRDDVAAFRVPLTDGPGNDPRRIAMAIGFIREIAASGGRILVHCRAGRSRSVVVVGRYLMEYGGLSKPAALATIAAKREICLSRGIEDVLTCAMAR